MESKSLSKKTSIVRHKLEQNFQHINKTQCPNTKDAQIGYEETFAPIDKLESIRILLVIACSLRIKLYQKDVNSAFLNEIFNEEVYVEQPKGFEDPKFPSHVYRLKKAPNGLKQAPRAWYGRLTTYLLEKKFDNGEVDKTLFI